MRKWILTAVLLAVVSALITTSYIHHRNNRNGLHRSLTKQIGEDLIASKDSKLVVRVGDGLRVKLSEYTAGHAKVADVRVGDEPPPTGDGSATSRVILSNDAGGVLSIRLKPAGDGRFHILGFVTLSKK